MKASKKNVKTPDPFADTLHVRRLSTTTTDIKTPYQSNEGTKHRNNGYQLSLYNRTHRDPRLDETGLQCFMSDKNKQTKMNHDYGKIHIRGQLKKAPIGASVKMISMKMPRFGRCQAVIKPMLDRCANENEDNFHDEHIEESVPKNLLEEAQKEIDISQNQLQQIHSILKKKNADENVLIQPKWNPPPVKIKENRDSKERVVASLTTLNKKLSDMQEKYFNQKKTTTFKSIDDIPSKLRTQSTSDIDIDDSNSDNDIQLEDKDEIYRKLGFLGIQETKQVEHNWTTPQSIFYSQEIHELPANRKTINVGRRNNSDRHLELENDYSDELKLFYTSSQDLMEKNTEKDYANEFRANSDTSEYEPKKTLEQLKQRDSNYKTRTSNNTRGKLTTKPFHSDKNYSKSISDVLKRGVHSSDISMYIPDETFQEKHFLRESSPDLPNIKSGSESNTEMSEIFCDANTLLEEKYKRIEELQEVLLKEDDKLNQKRGELYHQRSEIMDDACPFAEKSTEELKAEETKKMKQVHSKTSATDYYDCNSKLQNSFIPSSKKIFYDNFGIQKWRSEKRSSEYLLNNTSSDIKSTIFENTDLQESVLKSDYLTKTFILKPSKPLAEIKQAEVTQRNSEEFFNGVLDITDSKTKNSKNMRDMYSSLTKALSNSFYTIQPQN